MSESKHKDPKDYKTHVGNFTSGKLDYLQSEQENGEGKALLARLRHAAGKSPEESPEIWGFILSEFDSYKSKEAIIDETTGIPGRKKQGIFDSRKRGINRNSFWEFLKKRFNQRKLCEDKDETLDSVQNHRRDCKTTSSND